MDQQAVVSVLAWAAIALGTGLLSCLIWFVLRVVSQLDRLEALVVGEIHKLELRITKLEAWREGKAAAKGDD